MDDLLKQIGSRILNRRKQLRMTQEELAEKAGITPQTVSAAELGKKHCALKISSVSVRRWRSAPTTCFSAK